MRTRNTDTAKSAPAPKKTPPAKKSAAKTIITPPSGEPSSAESPVTVAQKQSDTKRGPVTRGKQVKSAEFISTSAAGTEPVPEPTPAVEEPNILDDAVEIAAESKPTTRRKTVRRVVRKVVRKAPASARVASGQTPNPEESDQAQVEDVTKENHLLGAEEPEVRTENVEVPESGEESSVRNIEESVTEHLKTSNVEDIARKEEELDKNEIPSGGNVVQSVEEQEATPPGADPVEDSKPSMQEEEGSRIQQEEELKIIEDTAEPTTRGKTARKVVRKVVRKALASARVASGQTPNPEKSDQAQVEVVTKENHFFLGAEEPEVRTENVEVPENKEESSAKNIEESVTEDLKTSHVEDIAKREEKLDKDKIPSGQNVVQSVEEQEAAALGVDPVEDPEPTVQEEEGLRIQQEEELKSIEDTAEPKNEIGEMEGEPKEEMTDFDGLLEEGDEEGIADPEVHDELSQEDYREGDLQGQREEAAALEEERAELNAAAKERKLRKELEIFVGGLDRDVVEEDIRRVFQNAGEVVDVRLYKDPTTNKNKGYAFVRFATKEQVSRALSEMRNPVIRGKRCGIAASEDNDTLFLGNICNTWTNEAVKQKLKEYGIEAVERITLVADPKQEGLSRGFAFLEFSSHAEAMLAYKRLQKPDVIFGHSERTVKVAFAEPLREPDPEVMSQVKSVFVDGLPPHWDEDHVREKFIKFGEIARVTLARNMSMAKRKDFGFVDFTTHEAAVACVEGINNTELGDGNSKTKLRARLSNPLPKTQAVKGGMAGGFRISRGSGGTFSRFGGRGFGRGGHAFNRANILRGRDFYPRGHSQGGRIGFANARELDSPYPPFHGRQNSGPGGSWGFRGAHQMPSGAPLSTRPNQDRARYGGHGGYDPLRMPPFPSEDAFNQPFPERQFSDHYFYEDTARGMKRPYFMAHQNPDYVEPSTRRPRFEYPETSISHHGTRHRDSFGADGGFYPQDYYGSDYDVGMHPSFYRGDRPYGRGYYY